MHASTRKCNRDRQARARTNTYAQVGVRACTHAHARTCAGMSTNTATRIELLHLDPEFLDQKSYRHDDCML
eukprot:6184936-Pleurochrysis_carterae.AAC.2